MRLPEDEGPGGVPRLAVRLQDDQPALAALLGGNQHVHSSLLEGNVIEIIYSTVLQDTKHVSIFLSGLSHESLTEIACLCRGLQQTKNVLF